MSQSIPEKYLDLFTKRAFGSLATLMPDGGPQVTPVWVDLDGDLVVVNTAKGRQKDKNMRRDPRVALSLTDITNPYRTAPARTAATGSAARCRGLAADRRPGTPPGRTRCPQPRCAHRAAGTPG